MSEGGCSARSHVPVEELSVRVLLGSGRFVELLDTVVIYSDRYGITAGHFNPVRVVEIEGAPFPLVVVLKPFKTDLATFPRFLPHLLPKLGVWNVGAVVHDYLLQHRHEYPFMRRLDIDRLFREVLRRKGMGKMSRTAFYLAVRLNSLLKEG